MIAKDTPSHPFRLHGIEGADTGTLRVLLRFLYEGYIEHQSFDVVSKLMSLAKCLQIQSVKSACEIVMNEQLARSKVSFVTQKIHYDICFCL